MGYPEANTSKVTGILLFGVTIACLGNSFLYGYQIGVVNQPSSIIQAFYNKTYYERRGGNWDTMVNYNDYKHAENQSDSEALYKYNISVDSSRQLSDNISIKLLEPKDFGADTSLLLEDWELKILWSTTVAAFVLFGMIGAFLSAKVADFFGRKRGMIVITVIMFAAAVFGGISQMAKSPECLILSRVLVGLHSGLNITLVTLYLAEISPKGIRGAVGTCHQLAITIGILISQVLGLPVLLGTKSLWPVLFVFNAVPSFLCVVCMPFCPESPRYLLIKKGQETEATTALIKFRGYDNVGEEIEEMRVEARKSVGVKNYTIKELLIATELRMPVIIACVLQICQQWSGINAVMSYSKMLFEKVSIDKETIPYIVVSTGAVNVVITVVCVPLMEKLGRRPLLLFSMFTMFVSFLVMTTFLNLSEKESLKEHQAGFAIVCIIVMLTYIIGFSVGLGPIPFLIVGEIFRQEPRPAAISLSLACNWVCNFILMLTFPFLQDGLQEFVYILFCVILALGLVFTFFFIPETKNRTFDEIANSISFGGRARGQNKAYGVHDESEPMGNSKV